MVLVFLRVLTVIISIMLSVLPVCMDALVVLTVQHAIFALLVIYILEYVNNFALMDGSVP